MGDIGEAERGQLGLWKNSATAWVTVNRLLGYLVVS